ncbi:MAG: hypothetical protein AB4911_21280 [Oscillochloridaceae bacterium umkhey_bin13]
MAIETWLNITLEYFSREERIAVCTILHRVGVPRYYRDEFSLGSFISSTPPEEALTADGVTLYCESQKEARRVRKEIYAALGPDEYGFSRRGRGFIELLYGEDDPAPTRRT